MENVTETLREAGLTNRSVAEYVNEWADLLKPDKIEVIDARDDARLIEEALAAGEIAPAGEGRYYSRSYHKDTARSEERTVVSTHNPREEGVYNNWRDASRVTQLQKERMTGAFAGKTMYVLPYLMAPVGSPLEKWARGVEITDNRTVCLQMIRMARVGVQYLNDVEDEGMFVRAVHVTGDLQNLGQGTDHDQRLFATVADERTILHYGSSYGGNALLGKIAHGLRQASYDGWVSGEFMSEQFMLIGIKDKVKNKTYYVCGGFPSASGKTNLAMMLAPKALGERYEVHFYGDDIVWLRVGDDGRIYGMNPEYGAFGVAKDTNWKTNPTAMDSIEPGTNVLFTNVAYNPDTQEVWWEGKTPDYPQDVSGWLDWKGQPIANRPADRQRSKAKGDEWAHPNSRFTTQLGNVPNVAPDYERPQGVPIDAIIFGGRVADREPLIRAITDVAEGVYDGLTMGVQATFAAEGKEGVMRYDPMSMRPFMSYPEGDYAQHWLNVIGSAEYKPIFAHVNWFQRDPEDGHFLWTGYRDNLRALLWLLDLKEGNVEGVASPVGILPKKSELNLDGYEGSDADLDKILTLDYAVWSQEMKSREQHLLQFKNLPEEIWQAHRKVAREVQEAQK
ncbi:phosphoenolpyruvate carboxykinase (GTP) [Gleimia hominis]|uniref:phosphoenolpyruvate carboxykinase (GTP) n=1 Tax=Gleimia hominis TaxID=595468 RepID=UPI000C80073D|nr:phosphoenolpyruvate carboxykinase (GTP) [Gleimia hominis]WIK64009.1 phosphoenolpyruvate carboxykinase (GTP) [Gleimia hominis]